MNRKESNAFPVLWEVQYGCPIAPYLFSFVGEALNIATKQSQDASGLQGIYLFEEARQLFLSQFADELYDPRRLLMLAQPD